jgi:hypothetical protein
LLFIWKGGGNRFALVPPPIALSRFDRKSFD